jgi:hypothetical protein
MRGYGDVGWLDNKGNEKSTPQPISSKVDGVGDKSSCKTLVPSNALLEKLDVLLAGPSQFRFASSCTFHKILSCSESALLYRYMLISCDKFIS